jgi:hypothetical protein
MGKKMADVRPGGKVSSSHWLSVEALALLEKLKLHLGIPQSAILETLIREKARKEGIR